LHAVEIKLAPDLDLSEAQLGKPSNPKELNESMKRWNSKFSEKLLRIHQQLMSMPAHYRYLAVSAQCLDRVLGELGHSGLFPEDGIGRLGVIAVTEKGQESPTAEMVFVPERFRVDPAKLKAIETRLLAKSRPDIEVRI
jgi:hypothetical protein